MLLKGDDVGGCQLLSLVLAGSPRRPHFFAARTMRPDLLKNPVHVDIEAVSGQSGSETERTPQNDASGQWVSIRGQSSGDLIRHNLSKDL